MLTVALRVMLKQHRVRPLAVLYYAINGIQ